MPKQMKSSQSNIGLALLLTSCEESHLNERDIVPQQDAKVTTVGNMSRNQSFQIMQTLLGDEQNVQICLNVS